MWAKRRQPRASAAREALGSYAGHAREGAGIDHLAVAVAGAQLPDEGVHDEVVDVDDSDDQKPALDQAEAGREEGQGQELEETIGQQQARSVEEERVIERAVAIAGAAHLILHVEDHDDREVLDAMKHGGPDEGTERRKYEPPEAVGDHHQDTDQWHRSSGAAP